MLDTTRQLRMHLFLFAFTLLTTQGSIYAQPANTVVASTDLGAAAKRDDSVLAHRAVAALEQLKASVIAYGSYDEFESDGGLARVPIETFTDKLNLVIPEVESILSQLSDAKLRSHLSNSLYSYRDGAFWWAKLDQKKVVIAANLRLGFTATTRAESFFMSTVPYTVAIHWRQANKYLLRAQKVLAEANPTASQPSRSLLPDRDRDGSIR